MARNAFTICGILCTNSAVILGTILNAQMALRFTPIFAYFASAAARLPRKGSFANVLLTPEVRALLPRNGF